MTGITEEDLLGSLLESSKSSVPDDYYDMMDHEASKFPFLERLHHYMECYLISEHNHRSVELAILVEAGQSYGRWGP